MQKSVLIDVGTGKALETGASPVTGNQVLEFIQPPAIHGVWTSYNAALNGSAIIVNCLSKRAIGLTDMILSVQSANQTFTLRYYDGTNAANLIAVNTNSNPVQLCTSFAGRIEGWKDAYIQATTTGAMTVSIMFGYCNIPESLTLPYSEWLNRRTTPT